MNPTTYRKFLVLMLGGTFIFSGISCAYNEIPMEIHLAQKEGGGNISPHTNIDRNGKTAIVFVHGFNGDKEDTWTNSQTDIFWPDLVHNKLNGSGHYDVFVTSYDTAWYRPTPILYKLGKAFKEKLEEHCIIPNDIDRNRCEHKDKETGLTREESVYQQVIFVGHSMGNLIALMAILEGGAVFDLKVPLFFSIAAPWDGSALADHLLPFFSNSQLRDLKQINENSFLNLLGSVWGRRKFAGHIICAAEGQETPYFLFGLFKTRVVTDTSAFKICHPDDRTIFSFEDHQSIVKPRVPSKHENIHTWFMTNMKKLQDLARPWEPQHWRVKVDREDCPKGRLKKVRKIIIGGKDFIESDLLAQIIGTILKRIIIQKSGQPSGTDYCMKEEEAVTDKKNVHEIQVDIKLHHGNGPHLLSELKNENVDIYAEYSGALRYSYLDLDTPKLDDPTEEKEHHPDSINKLLKDAKYPSFNRMKLLPPLGLDSKFVLFMRLDTARALGFKMVNSASGKQEVQYSEILANAGKLAIFADTDLFSRKDAWGGLVTSKDAEALEKITRVPMYHDSIYQRLQEACKNENGKHACLAEGGQNVDGVIAIGFNTDPELLTDEYVKIDRKFPSHFASPIVHRFLDIGFPEIKPIEALENRLRVFTGEKKFCSTEEMAELIRRVREKCPPSSCKTNDETYKSVIQSVADEFIETKKL